MHKMSPEKALSKLGEDYKSANGHCGQSVTRCLSGLSKIRAGDPRPSGGQKGTSKAEQHPRHLPTEQEKLDPMFVRQNG